MPVARCVLVLNHNRRNLDLLGEFLSKAGFTMLPAQSLEEMDAALTPGAAISLALLDLAGFDSKIWDRCDKLRQSGIPFLVISPRPAPPLDAGGLRGAKGVLEKPVSSRALLTMIQALVQ